MSSTINFPASLTPEEIRLKGMFEKLKNIRRAIQIARGGAAVETRLERRNVYKRSIEEAEVAREEAKRKVISGAMTINKVEEKCTFKRSKLQAKKLKAGETQSFSRAIFANFDADSTQASTSDFPHSPNKSLPPKKHDNSPNIPDNFQTTGGNLNNDTNSSSSHGQTLPFYSNRAPVNEEEEQNRKLYVRAYDLTEERLRKRFGQFGVVSGVRVEDRQRSAFVTFETRQQAYGAMKEMDGNMMNGITLRVSFARRQFANNRPIPRTNTIPPLMQGIYAETQNQMEKRTLVSYDDADTFATND